MFRPSANKPQKVDRAQRIRQFARPSPNLLNQSIALPKHSCQKVADTIQILYLSVAGVLTKC